MGALFGECLVIINDDLKPDFRYNIKQKGAMLAKGRLLGVQFKELFSNNLYLEIGQYENEMADLLRAGLKNFKMYVDSPTNQLFPIVNDKLIKELQKDFSFNIMDKIDDDHHCIRLVTSWATPQEAVENFVEKINQEFVD